MAKDSTKGTLSSPQHIKIPAKGDASDEKSVVDIDHTAAIVVEANRRKKPSNLSAAFTANQYKALAYIGVEGNAGRFASRAGIIQLNDRDQKNDPMSVHAVHESVEALLTFGAIAIERGQERTNPLGRSVDVFKLTELGRFLLKHEAERIEFIKRYRLAELQQQERSHNQLN